MSEPAAAFIKLQTDRQRLTGWLASRPQPASRWDDWRDLGGRWYFEGGVGPLAELPQAELDNKLTFVDGWLADFADNLAVLQMVLDYAPQQARIAALSAERDVFVGGSLMYSENLDDFILFLALARSAADHLGPEDHGLALIHDFVFGYPDETEPTAALRLGPDGQSSFLAASERANAVPAFQPIADAMLDEQPIPDFPDPHQYADLRAKIGGR